MTGPNAGHNPGGHASPSQWHPPVSTVPIPANLVEAAKQINNELFRRSNAPIFLSPQAREELEIRHAEYLGNLGKSAIWIARERNLATVDREHVKEASSRMSGGGKPKVIDALASTLGGVATGGAVASVYTITFMPGPHGTGEVLVAGGLGVVGAVLLTIYFVRLKMKS